MATINLGAIKFKWQGAYNAGTAYTVDDVVSYNGSSYICILASTGNLPTNATYWEQMSSAGTNGTDGTDLTTTLTTQGDIVYRDASGLARLGAGTSGQFLKTLGTGANPVWADSGGAIKQIRIGGTSASQYSNTGTSYYDVGSDYNVGITPTSSSNRILIYVQTAIQMSSQGRAYFTIEKSGDTSGNGDLHTNLNVSADSIANQENITSQGNGYISFLHIDNTIASTNALNYKLRARTSLSTPLTCGVASSANFMMAIELDGGLF